MGSKPIEGASRRDGFVAAPERFTIVRDKTHSLYDKRVDEIPDSHPELQALKESIKVYGVQMQIQVVEDGEDLLIKDGNQRVRACIMANAELRKERQDVHLVGFKKVPLAEGRVQEEKSAANIRVTSPVMTRAHEAIEHANHGKIPAQIAVCMGCSEAQVNNYLALAGATPDLQKAVAAGLPMTVGVKIAKMKRDKQPEAVAKLRAAGATKGRRAAEGAKAIRQGKDVQTAPTTRARNRSVVDAVAAALRERDAGDGLKADADNWLACLRWVAGEDVELPDDVLEILNELKDAKAKAA